MSDEQPSQPQEPLNYETLLPVDEHEEEVSVDGRKERRRGIYLLPNLFTTGALFSGFYAIVAGMHGKFEIAAIAIFVAMIFDGLDGRVARLTNTQSKFGAEYDSLSDMVSFGVAPALVMFSWALNELGKFGWAVSSMSPVRHCGWRDLIRRSTRRIKIIFRGLQVLPRLPWWRPPCGCAPRKAGWTENFPLRCRSLRLCSPRLSVF